MRAADDRDRSANLDSLKQGEWHQQTLGKVRKPSDDAQKLSPPSHLQFTTASPLPQQGETSTSLRESLRISRLAGRVPCDLVSRPTNRVHAW